MSKGKGNRPTVMVACANGSVAASVRQAGGEVMVPGYDPEQAIERLSKCDALIITGGGDVNPALYGATRHREVYGLSPDRDLIELGLIGAARTLGMPVLGICRGAQLLNVEAGGTLHQHLPDRLKGSTRHNCATMPVLTVKGSITAKALGEEPKMLHLHHQSVRKVAPGFTITARHADGTVEAIESTDGRVVGVQFHPESSRGGERLFTFLVRAAKNYRQRVTRKGTPELATPEVYLRAWPTAIDAYVSRYAPPVRKASKSKAPKARALALVESRPTLDLDVDPDERRPVRWCPEHGIAFDNFADYEDHCEFFCEG